jgi:hypothetical protein
VTSRFVATTLLDVYRDNTGLAASGSFDGYNDDAPSAVPLLTRRPSHLKQSTSQPLDPVTGRVTTVERWVGRMRPGTDVQADDRIHEPSTDRWFIVNAADTPAGVTGAADVRLTLTRVAR